MSTTARAEASPSTGNLASCLRRVQIRDFKGIAFCDVELGPFTILVGRNGAGKSNFLDALRFVADALTTSPQQAIRTRGSINAVRRASPSLGFSMELEISLTSGRTASYGFEVQWDKDEGCTIFWEELDVHEADSSLIFQYSIFDGMMDRSSFDAEPSDFGSTLLSRPAFKTCDLSEVRDALRSLNVYSINPGVMRPFEGPKGTRILEPDGGNIAGAFKEIDKRLPTARERFLGYLQTIVPEIVDVRYVEFGPIESVAFDQKVADHGELAPFYPQSVSDGTLRAFGILVAINQQPSDKHPMRMVAIEEPETGLHPAAAGALMDALREASHWTQVIVTTHSPDLLDQVNLETDTVLVALSNEGQSQIALLDAASRKTIQEHLQSPGDLQRMDFFQPDARDLERQRTQMQTLQWLRGIAGAGSPADQPHRRGKRGAFVDQNAAFADSQRVSWRMRAGSGSILNTDHAETLPERPI